MIRSLAVAITLLAAPCTAAAHTYPPPGPTPECFDDPDPLGGCDGIPPWLETPFVSDEDTDTYCWGPDSTGGAWWCPPDTPEPHPPTD